MTLRTWRPVTLETTLSASDSGTSKNEKRSSMRTLRTASPSSPAPAVTALMMSATSSPAARPALTMSLALGSAPLRATWGFSWRRGRSDTFAGATLAPGSHGAIASIPAWRSIAAMSRFCRGS